MAWINKYLNQDEIKKISDVVGQVETITSAEIVPMVVKKSTPTGHVLPIVALLIMIGFLYFDINSTYFFDWGYWIYPILILGAVFLAWPLAKIFFVQRILTNDLDEIQQVNRRAELEFYRLIKNKTSGKTGVLLFISIMERRAVVLADEAISSKLPKETWDQVLQEIISGIKRQSLAEGLIKAIEACEALLQQQYPPQQNNINELANKLIVKE